MPVASKCKKAKPRDHIKLRGLFRVALEKNGEIVGDSGFCPNQVTNLGFDQYLAQLLGAVAGSKQVGYVALGTGSAPNASHTTLDGEIMASTKRKAVTAATTGSKTVRFTATFASSDSFITGASNISNIGLFNSTQTNATLFAGNTYASSALNTNQNVNVTYDIQFS